MRRVICVTRGLFCLLEAEPHLIRRKPGLKIKLELDRDQILARARHTPFSSFHVLRVRQNEGE